MTYSKSLTLDRPEVGPWRTAIDGITLSNGEGQENARRAAVLLGSPRSVGVSARGSELGILCSVGSPRPANAAGSRAMALIRILLGQRVVPNPQPSHAVDSSEDL